MKSNLYRRFVVASQSITWLIGRLLKLRFAVEHHPRGLFEQGRQRCLILAPTHQLVLDPFLIMTAMRYRQWRALIPLRTLATQTFDGPLRWFKPLIRIVYRLEGAVELPPKEEQNTLPEKLHGLLEALASGDVVMIFPEGDIGKEALLPIGTFAPGVVYLQRMSGAPIVPMAIWMSERRWPRRRYVVEIGRPTEIPDSLDLEAGANWLRERTLELYKMAKRDDRRGSGACTPRMGRQRRNLMAKAREIMTSDPVCVGPNDTVQAAAQLMKSNHVGPIPVIDGSGQIVGIVTDRDLAIKVVAEGRAPDSTKVADVMSRDVFTCGPNDDVEQVIHTMEEHQVRRVPIVDEECCLVGIVAQADVATRSGEREKVAEAVEEISRPSDRESA